MKLVFDIALIFGAMFGVGLLITFILWFKFFPLLQSVDPELYEKIRFRVKPSLSTPYRDFIFKKEFESYPNQIVKSYSKKLYWVGKVAQWGFNIYMLLMVVLIIIQLTRI